MTTRIDEELSEEFELIRDAVRQWGALPAPNTVNFLRQNYDELAKSLYTHCFSAKGENLARRARALILLLSESEQQEKNLTKTLDLTWYRHGIDEQLDRVHADGRLLALFADRVFKRKLPNDPALVEAALARCEKVTFPDDLSRHIGDMAVRYCESLPMPKSCAENATALFRLLDESGFKSAKDRRRLQSLGEIVGLRDAWSLDPSDAFAEQALSELNPTTGTERSAWLALISHCQTASNSPSKKWHAGADQQIEAIGVESFTDRFDRWIRLIGEPGSVERQIYYSDDYTNRTLLLDENVDIVCGMIWAASRSATLAPAIAHAAAAGYKKIYQGNVRSERIGAAAVRALGVMTDRRAVEELAKLEMIIRTPKARKVLTKVLDAAAEREGVTRDDLAETAAPEFGLSDGVVSQTFGDATAQIRLDGEKARVSWIDADGKPKRSIPKQTKADHPEAPAEIKALAKDLETAVVAQRRRIERLMRAQRSWPADRWLALYHNHPLVGLIARRLIWDIDGTACIWHNDAMRSADGEAIDPTGEVRLWHPIGREIDEVTRWRETIENRQITQPFKQAHREVYILTDAERTTGVYSNRFAAHVLKTAALSALCQTRGWICGLYGGESSPRLDLPTFSLRAEYWVDAAGEEYTDFGTPKYLATDQVRFYEIGGTEPLPLDRVHPLALSEAMRDVDMFVGITSVGNDPQWNDGGPDGRYRDYWHSYSFGDLSGTAQTRKAVLERLVPKLKIAERCSFTDKFLVVRGDVRTYKIHLGSGNILMEPNDQYLCIVAGRAMEKGADKVFLPFEGDRTLAIVISKALMLAEDTKIKDATILSQIGKSR